MPDNSKPDFTDALKTIPMTEDEVKDFTKLKNTEVAFNDLAEKYGGLKQEFWKKFIATHAIPEGYNLAVDADKNIVLIQKIQPKMAQPSILVPQGVRLKGEKN